ncbi:MAG: RadC family protein [Fibrobacterota bacterium]
MTIPIKQWAEEDCPRERLHSLGPASLSDSEIIAILINSGSRAKSAVETAREIIKSFGGLRGISASDAGDFCRCTGVGPAKAARISAAVELGRRVSSLKLSAKRPLSCPNAVADYMRPLISHCRQENLFLICLDSRNRPIGEAIKLFTGSVNETMAHPREIFRSAVSRSAVSIILVHNHPSGDSGPSSNDRKMTRVVAKAGEMMGVKLLDHIIVGYGGHYSMQEHSDF